MVKEFPALLAVTLVLVACQRVASTPTATPTPGPTETIQEEWSIPIDKYVFIERWIEIYEDSAMSVYLDFPTYAFDQNSGQLRPDIVPPGRWFPLEDLTALKVVYGRGTSRTGSAGTGVNSRVFAITELSFSEPAKEDTDVVLTVERVDADGVVYLKRGAQRIVLQPGQDWTSDGKCVVEWGGITSEISYRERISNYGVLDKSKIQVTK